MIRLSPFQRWGWTTASDTPPEILRRWDVRRSVGRNGRSWAEGCVGLHRQTLRCRRAAASRRWTCQRRSDLKSHKSFLFCDRKLPKLNLARQEQRKDHIGLSFFDFFTSHTLHWHWICSFMARPRLAFLFLGEARSCNFIMSGSFSFLPPYARGEKKTFGCGVMRPRWASATSWHYPFHRGF